jgi:hypothetical protein
MNDVRVRRQDMAIMIVPTGGIQAGSGLFQQAMDA